MQSTGISPSLLLEYPSCEMGMFYSGTIIWYTVSLYDTVPCFSCTFTGWTTERRKTGGKGEAIDLGLALHNLIGWVLFANPRVLEIQVTSLNPPAVVGVCVNASERRDKWLTLWSIFISNSTRQKREGGFCVAKSCWFNFYFTEPGVVWTEVLYILTHGGWGQHRPVIFSLANFSEES